MGDNGFFGLELDGDSTVLRAVNISIRSIVLLALCAIGVIVIKNLYPKSNVDYRLSASFMFSLFCACSSPTSLIILIILNILHRPTRIVAAIWIEGSGCFFVSLLGTLVLRLYITFKPSMYRMSSTMICIFGIILILLLLVQIAFAVLYCLMDFAEFLVIYYNASIIWLLLYMLGSALAVVFFVCSSVSIRSNPFYDGQHSLYFPFSPGFEPIQAGKGSKFIVIVCDQRATKY